MMWKCFSVEATGRLLGIEGKMNGAKYTEILDDNLLQSDQDLNRTKFLSTQPRKCRSDFGTSL